MSQKQCFISDSRRCNASSQKDLVFIIGSGSSEFQEDIKSIITVLDGFGLAGYFALLSDKEKGLDAFCDKICSKIKESQFCIVMLNDPIFIDNTITHSQSHQVRAPRANVYYEFGIAVGLQKSVIPIIRKGFTLPFDVQHLDALIYDDTMDLNKKLKKVILSTLKKTKKEDGGTTNSEIVRLIYGPLYNMIDRFITKRTKFTVFNPTQFDNIINQHKYLLDKIDSPIRKELDLFYETLQELNQNIRASETIIRNVVAKVISDYFNIPYRRERTLFVEVNTDVTQLIYTIDNLLIQDTTPEVYYESLKAREHVKSLAYKLRSESNSDRIIVEAWEFSGVFDISYSKIFKNPRVSKMRQLEKDLETMSLELRGKLHNFC